MHAIHLSDSKHHLVVSRMESKKSYLIIGIIVTILAFVAVGYLFNQPTVAGLTNEGNSIDESLRKSDNPILYMPVDEEKWLPIVPPEPVGRSLKAFAETSMEMLVYDVKTKETRRIVKEISTLDKTALSLSGNQGSLSSESIPLSIKGVDDRVLITPTTTYPWRTIVKLRMEFPSGQYMASGFLIDGDHVLTAGHCVYNADLGEWATSIEVIPAMDEGYSPYYHAWAISMAISADWGDYGWYEEDFAVISLDRNIGDILGWMNQRYVFEADADVYTNLVNTAGYPGDLDGGDNMYFTEDWGESADYYNHFYWLDTYGGQSGSPVWYYDVDDPTVISIATYGEESDDVPNFGTRLSGYWVGIVNDAFGDEPPIDYANLIDDGQEYFGFMPLTVTAGVSFFNISSDVRNIGTADSGIFYVSYYASEDTEITASDYLIGVNELNSITPFTHAESDWSGTFPNIPTGTYYVGGIIDSTDVVPEPLDEGEDNNVFYQESYQLTVESESSPPGVPMLVYGTVYFDAVPAESGVNVSAKDGATVLTSVLTGANGAYALMVTGPAEGTSIGFYVEDELVETVQFNLGTTLADFDLVVVQGEEYEIELFEGWNLISLPFAPENRSVEAVLADIMDNVTCVYGFNGETKSWSIYLPAIPAGATLTEMFEDQGYWVLMETDGVWIPQ